MAFKIEITFEAPQFPPLSIHEQKKKRASFSHILPHFHKRDIVALEKWGLPGQARPGHAIPILVEMKSIELIIGA